MHCGVAEPFAAPLPPIWDRRVAALVAAAPGGSCMPLAPRHLYFVSRARNGHLAYSLQRESVIDSFKRSLPLTVERQRNRGRPDREAGHNLHGGVFENTHWRTVLLAERWNPLASSPLSPMAVILIGALLTIAGVAYMAVAAIRRGRLSDPIHLPTSAERPTPILQPQVRP